MMKIKIPFVRIICLTALISLIVGLVAGFNVASIDADFWNSLALFSVTLFLAIFGSLYAIQFGLESERLLICEIEKFSDINKNVSNIVLKYNATVKFDADSVVFPAIKQIYLLRNQLTFTTEIGSRYSAQLSLVENSYYDLAADIDNMQNRDVFLKRVKEMKNLSSLYISMRKERKTKNLV